MNLQKTQAGPERTKRTYAAPSLEIYGNLAHITGTVGNNGSMDGAGNGGVHNTK